MNYSFDTELAKLYGVNEAIMLNNFVFWIGKNKANKTHFYDNKYWTYNSIEAFCELFPFWSRDQIKRILKSLIDKKVIETGNYNQLPMDRTLWYCLVNQDEFLGFPHLAKSHNAFCETTQPIPYSKTTDNNIINIVGRLNEKSKKQFNYKSKVTASHISARLREGYQLEDFYRVIDHKCDQWMNDEKMKIYLRPETLFGNKFDGYLNESPKVNKQADINFDDRDAYCLPPSVRERLRNDQ